MDLKTILILGSLGTLIALFWEDFAAMFDGVGTGSNTKRGASPKKILKSKSKPSISSVRSKKVKSKSQESDLMD
jgi:hypothetical protein